MRLVTLLIGLIGLIFVICSSSLAVAKTISRGQTSSLPPVGKRIYIIDDSTPNSPVQIKDGSSKSTKVFLRDPGTTLPSGKLSIKTVKSRKKTGKSKGSGNKGRYQSAKLRFGKLPVVGRLSSPRVVFSREVLDIGRLDEPTQPDFFNRVFEPATDESF